MNSFVFTAIIMYVVLKPFICYLSNFRLFSSNITTKKSTLTGTHYYHESTPLLLSVSVATATITVVEFIIAPVVQMFYKTFLVHLSN